ncbi:MAG TPA: hypothetical protein VG602_01430 [Actinomycetota bacterium]|nr:hypothetical protein [Actinomycetota bacterium]
MTRRLAIRAGVRALTGLCILGLFMGPAFAQIPTQGSGKNMHWEANVANLGGNSLAFFERKQADGSIKRYAVAAAHGNGFDIIDITTPTSPQVVSRYVNDPSPTAGGPGLYYHPWVDVNPTRNIVALSLEATSPNVVRSPDHGFSTGVEFVDITNISNPVQLGKVSGISAHTIRMIGDNHVYTSLGDGTHIIDYTNPRQPKDLGVIKWCGHEFYEDPNIPGRTYMGNCGEFSGWRILDTTDPASPKVIADVNAREIQYAHEVYPAPDSSFVGVADFRGAGQTYTQCPGGGLHFYDISGKYVPGASLTTPKKMGAWFMPFVGATNDPSRPNWGSCTLHSWQMQPERLLFTAGLYSAGTWVGDPSAATKATGGLYTEYKGTVAAGPTTWGNTTGNWLSEGDFVNATQWIPFDIPAAKDHLFTNGLIRGVDVLHYAGPLPKKLSRLTIHATATGGAVSGVLERYAVLTYNGWENKPLAGKTVRVAAGGSAVTVTTGADGSFTANLALPAGTHEVTATWAGDGEYAENSVTRQVTV